ncbi:MAG: ABC transporter substrate-binding protein [Planctomycetota bacterium]
MRRSALPCALCTALPLLAAVTVGCGKDGGAAKAPPTSIKMATTTSTDNSGLLAVLLPAFKARHRIEVRVIAVGTGKAIKHGENGDVDVILVHARAAEEEFVAGGFGVNRRDVMHNDFVILGPAADPAGLKGSKDVAEAFRKLAAARQDFVSRGDDSGTHRKEKALWKDAGVEPSGSWYLSAGQGMGACLTMASEKAAYVMTDRGTYLAYRDKVKLEVLVEGGERLFNPYGVIAVNPDRHPHVEHEAAMTFIDWLTSAEAQKLIAGFKRGGEQLFYPDAVK